MKNKVYLHVIDTQLNQVIERRFRRRDCDGGVVFVEAGDKVGEAVHVVGVQRVPVQLVLTETKQTDN